MKVYVLVHDMSDFMPEVVNVYRDKESAIQKMEEYISTEWAGCSQDELEVDYESGYAVFSSAYSYDRLFIEEKVIC